MSRSLDNRKKKIRFIYGTMAGFCSVMRNLQEDYAIYSKNYCEEALALLGKSSVFIDSAEAVRTLGSIRMIDDDGINELFALSQQIAGLYHLKKQIKKSAAEITSAKKAAGNDIARLPPAWKIYLDKDGNIKEVKYGADKSKAQVVKSDGSAGKIINIGTEEHKEPGGLVKSLLKAAGLNATDEAGLSLQEKMLDSGLFYINKEEGWIENKKYFERMAPKDFLSIQDYKDATVKAVYDDDKGELAFTYKAGGKAENLFVIKASNRQKKREWPTISGKDITSNPDDIMYTDPPYGEEKAPYIPGKFPKGNWKITSFEKNGEKEYGPYKIRTDAWRLVEIWELAENKKKCLEWKLKRDSNGNALRAKDSGLLIHGGGWSESDLDNKKGSNKYTDTTLGCIRISNLDVLLIVKVLQAYLASKKFIALEVK